MTDKTTGWHSDTQALVVAREGMDLMREEILRLRSHIASLDYIPLRYRDRPPGFVEERRKHCTTPHLCFEFGDRVPVCGPCDTAAVKAVYQERQL